MTFGCIFYILSFCTISNFVLRTQFHHKLPRLSRHVSTETALRTKQFIFIIQYRGLSRLVSSYRTWHFFSTHLVGTCSIFLRKERVETSQMVCKMSCIDALGRFRSCFCDISFVQPQPFLSDDLYFLNINRRIMFWWVFIFSSHLKMMNLKCEKISKKIFCFYFLWNFNSCQVYERRQEIRVK